MNEGLVSGILALLGGLGGTVLLLMPGYVLGAVYSRGIRGPDVSDRTFVAVAAIGGISTHIVGLVFTISMARRISQDGVNDWIWLTAVWAAVVLLALPAFLGGVLGILADGRIPFTGRDTPRWIDILLSNLGLTVSARTQEAWNWVFHRNEGSWVRIRLNDARTILGKFNPRSFASSDANLRDIYLEELWVADADGWFAHPYPTTKGIWVAGDQIGAIEFFEGQDDNVPDRGAPDDR